MATAKEPIELAPVKYAISLGLPVPVTYPVSSSEYGCFISMGFNNLLGYTFVNYLLFYYNADFSY